MRFEFLMAGGKVNFIQVARAKNIYSRSRMTNVLEAKERNESTQLHDSAYGMNIIHESIPVPMTLVFHWIASELCSLPWMPADSQPPPRRPVAAAGR